MRSPSLVVFLSIARTLRKLERHLSKQNETLEALRSYLIPPVPAPNEEPDLLYADEEEDARDEMKELMRQYGYHPPEKD